ncbi:hypothetical protein U8Y35_002671 [Klebsiella pneumoniae]|nr:hypothetical protein [Klebsiella pneumoniae]
MVFVKRIVLISCIILISACANVTPEVITEVNKMVIPVMQSRDNSAKPDQKNISEVYSQNAEEINWLMVFLKSEYLNGTDKNDIFDVHSLAHKVYDSLSKLDEARLVNEQYFRDGNYEGLVGIKKMLITLKKSTQ